MAKKSVKHVQIDKSQAQILAIVAIGTVLTVFSIFGVKALISKGLYQSRALKARHEVVSQLQANYKAANSLFTQYKVFAEQDPNVLGGSAKGNGSSDGDNARIVLDSLPSKYDAPALASSIEKILTDQNFKFTSFSVVDDPVGNPDTAEANPESKTINFSFSGTTSYDGAVKVLQAFERSIRPFDIKSIDVSGTDQAMQLSVTATTTYQPAKSLDLSATKEVK